MSREASEFLGWAVRRERTSADPLDEKAMEDEGLARLAQLYQAADTRSVEAACKYRRALGAMALASTIITVSFLLYDEAEMYGLILVVGLTLLFGELVSRCARHLRWHEEYVQLRILAECLRVEAYLYYGGSCVRASEILPWSLKQDLGWVKDVLQDWERQNPLPSASHDVSGCWMEGQRAYHSQAIASAAHRYAVSQRVVRYAVALSAVLYVVALLFELSCGGWAMSALVPVDDLEFFRAAIKISLGTVSAATVFVGSYFEKLSLGRVLDDHRKMERLYEEALNRVRSEGQTPEFLRELAREELVENGNWYAYQQGNTPELAL